MANAALYTKIWTGLQVGSANYDKTGNNGLRTRNKLFIDTTGRNTRPEP